MMEDKNLIPQPPAANTPAEAQRTPELIGAEIRMYVEAGRRITLLCGIEIGRRLVEAKDMLSHGEWLPWLERETQISDRSAARYMQIFREYGAAQQSLFGPVANSPTLSNLSISNALRLLALPEEERESFAETNDVEHMSARDVEVLVKERTAELEAEKQKLADAVETLTNDREELHADVERAESKLDLSEQERAKVEEQLKRIQQELREIEARPQPVAVERDEKAIEEAVQAEREKAEAEKKEAEKDFRKKLKELKEQISSTASAKNELEKQLNELRAKADAAEQDGLEAEQLREKIKAMEAKLALATPEVAEFKAAFDRAQAELVTMLKALRKVQDEEVKTKLTQAAETMLGNFSRQIGG
jgi:DNA repair exonuclease SbcCD ATPase subunit